MFSKEHILEAQLTVCNSFPRNKGYKEVIITVAVYNMLLLSALLCGVCYSFPIYMCDVDFCQRQPCWKLGNFLVWTGV